MFDGETVQERHSIKPVIIRSLSKWEETWAISHKGALQPIRKRACIKISSYSTCACFVSFEGKKQTKKNNFEIVYMLTIVLKLLHWFIKSSISLYYKRLGDKIYHECLLTYLLFLLLPAQGAPSCFFHNHTACLPRLFLFLFLGFLLVELDSVYRLYMFSVNVWIQSALCPSSETCSYLKLREAWLALSHIQAD